MEIELGPPPPQIPIPGVPPFSEAKWLRERRALIAKLYVTDLRVVSDCEAQQIDRTNHFVRGHYIAADSGTKYHYLLDAKTGDLLVSEIE